MFALLLAIPGFAAENGLPLARLVVDYGGSVYDRRSGATFYDEAGRLVRDAKGRLNLAECSLYYAAALLMTGGDATRAGQIIEAVLAHQDRAPASRTRGQFRWYADEDAEFDLAHVALAPTLAHTGRCRSGCRRRFPAAPHSPCAP